MFKSASVDVGTRLRAQNAQFRIQPAGAGHRQIRDSGTGKEDLASIATAGYARGLRSMAEMHKIDTDNDGTVSKEEWLACQSKVFDMMDADKSGALGPRAFLAGATSGAKQ